MRRFLFNFLVCLLFCFSAASNSQDFTIDFSSQRRYVETLNAIRAAIGTPLSNISQGGVSVSVINHVPESNYISVNIRGLDAYQERFNHLQLIMERENLYVSGFVNTVTRTFYRFSDFSHISVPGVTTVTMTTDSSYTTLQRIAGIERSGMQINRHSLVSSYLDLMEFSGDAMNRGASRAMLRFVTVTSEALRFRQIQREFRIVLEDSGHTYVMSPQDVELTLNWGRISNVLPGYSGENGVRIGRINFNGLTSILGSVAVILNCNNHEVRSVRSIESIKPVCPGFSDRPNITINNILWERSTVAAFLNRKPQSSK
ncbi:TPA: ribosome-inactivating family protein [Escherichia coli]